MARCEQRQLLSSRCCSVLLLLSLLLRCSLPTAAALDPRGASSVIREDEPRDGAFTVESLPGFDGPLPSLHRAG